MLRLVGVLCAVAFAPLELATLTSSAFAASEIVSLGTQPPECAVAHLNSYTEPKCLLQTRLGTLSISPHVVHAGGTLRGTVSIAPGCILGGKKYWDEELVGESPERVCPVGWAGMTSWIERSQLKALAKYLKKDITVQSGCKEETTCVLQVAPQTPTVPYQTVAVGIENNQGVGESRDYFAIIGKDYFELGGHLKNEKGEAIANVPVTVVGRHSRKSVNTDSSGGYAFVLKRGTYTVLATAHGVKPVGSADCHAEARSCRVNVDQDRTADFTISEPLLIEYQMDPKLVEDQLTGLIHYPGESEVDPKTFTVLVTLAAHDNQPCDPKADYAFTLDGGAVNASPGSAPCEFKVEATKQGKQELAVTGKSPDGVVASGKRKIVVRDFLIVGLGDSVASGEGNPDVGAAHGPVRWEEPRCDRSAHSFEARAAESIEAAHQHRAAVTFLHLACSGAEVTKGLVGPYFGIGPGKGGPLPLSSQVSRMTQLIGSRKVDALLLSIGANDIGFGEIVQFCVKEPFCMRKPFMSTGKTLDQVTQKKLRELPRHYDVLASRLKAAGVPADRVYITQYFDPMHDSQGRICEHIINIAGLLGIDREEAEWASERVLTPLNEQVAAAAEAHHWNLITGIAQGFNAHGYCASDPWVVSVSQSLSEQHDENGTLHPNVAGHEFIAHQVLAGGLEKELFPGGEPRPLK